MKNGFLYEFINIFLNSLKYLNLVELFKIVSIKITPCNSSIETKVKNSRVSVDLFIVIKWLFILYLWVFEITDSFFVITVWYLLTANLYTYFYYHTWSSKILRDKHFNTDRIKHRFVNLLQAIFYSIFGFAYLYHQPYSSEFIWNGGDPSVMHSIMFSLSNSLTASYDQVKPSTEIAYFITIIQLLMIFIFLTIIISGSIPQVNLKKQKE